MANLSTLTDNFDDNSIDVVKWPGNYGTTTETGGRARLTCDTSFNAYVSAATYTFDSFYLRAYPAAAAGAASTAYLSVFLASTGQPAGTNVGYSIDAVTGNVQLINWVGFSDAGLVTLTYDATAHAWLRIGASAGTLVWQTSPDGSTWTTRRSITTPAWLAAASDVKVFCEAHRDSGTNNFAEIDNFNTVPFSTVNATGDATLGALTAAATGTRTTPGSAAATLGALTAAATGTRTTPASAAATLGAITAAATGTRTTPAAGDATLGALTAAATGTRTVPAGADATLAGLTAAAIGTRTTPGSAAATLGGITAAAAGRLAVAAAGTVALGALTATATAPSRTTPRPDAGTTARPDSGITSRPYAGITARP